MEFFDISDKKCDGVSLQLDRISPEDPARGWVPAYHFFIIDENGERVGFCDLRIGHSEGLYYGGNIGYTVYEEHRGNHYAEKAVRLLFELAKLHDMGYVYITCQPQNAPSRRTCERLGGEFLGIVELPEDNDMRVNDGHTCECVFRSEL